MSNINLKVPNVNELHYRQKWLKDPKTMSYNAGYDMDLKGYDKAGFIYTELEKKELVFGKESVARQLIITKDMYFKKIIY